MENGNSNIAGRTARRFAMIPRAVFCSGALFAAGVLLVFGAGGNFMAEKEADLDLDGKHEQIVLNSELDPALQVRRGGEVLWSGVPGAWRPWKLEIADVDGDGRREIVVGVFKSTKFFPNPHNCLFIYGWAGGRAFPKWLGSSLSRPFSDVLFIDLDGQAGDELVALETTLEGKMTVAVYKWNSFGFTLDREQGEWRTATGLMNENGKVSLEADGVRIYLSNEKARKK